MLDRDGRVTVEITRAQLERWAGTPLSDENVAALEKLIPNSSIPEAIATIISGWLVTPAAQQAWYACAHRADYGSAAEHERDCEPCQDEPTWSEEPA